MPNEAPRAASRLLAAGAIGALSAAAACGAFSSSTPAAPADGGADAAADSTTGGADATLDARPPNDDGGGTDAGSDGSPCVGAHVFCDDFDRSTPLVGTPYWGSVTIGDGGTLLIAPPAPPGPPSPPNALVAMAQPAGAALHDVAIAPFKVTLPGIHCGASFRIDQRGTSEVGLVALSLYAPPPDGSVDRPYYRMELRGGGGAGSDTVQEYGLTDLSAPLGAHVMATETFAAQTWHRIELRAKTGLGGAATVLVDGALVGTSIFALTGISPPNDGSLQVGIDAFAGDGTWAVAFDDVVCDAAP